RARRRAHRQPRAALQRARRRAARAGRAAVEGDARADPRRAVGRHVLSAGRAVRHARRLLRAARLGRGRRADARAPGDAGTLELRHRLVVPSFRTSTRLLAWLCAAALLATVTATADPVKGRFPEGRT